MIAADNDANKWLPKPNNLRERWTAFRYRKAHYHERVSRIGQLRGQTCFVFCPACQSEMAGNPATKFIDATRVTYWCGHCKTGSVWDFDSYPVPVRVTI